MGLEISGLLEVRRGLARVGDGLARQLNDSVEGAAAVIANDARGRVPVRTGRLRNSIRSRGGVVSAGDGVRYAVAIHFGSRARNIAARPFLYDALDAREAAVRERFESDVDRFVEDSFRGG